MCMHVESSPPIACSVMREAQPMRLLRHIGVGKGEKPDVSPNWDGCRMVAEKMQEGLGAL